MTEAPAQLLIGAVVLFLVFTAVRAFWPRTARAERLQVRAAHSLAVSKGSNPKRTPQERAASLIEAGRIALESMDRPRLAAQHAAWAHQLYPSASGLVPLAVAAFTRARRVRALEQLLWITADAAPVGREAIDALIALYEGPLKSPERARVLARWLVESQPSTDEDE